MSSSKSRTLDSLIANLSDPAYQINRLARMIHEDADRHGLWDDFREAMRRFEDREDSARLSALRYYATGVVSGEVSEMRSAHEDKAHYAEEMADVLIALLSTAEELRIDLGGEVVRKMEINKGRPWKHGKENEGEA